ncbi:glycoside hydrolase family 3 protein [Plenodomus tracheiphilus IPT5]|uniref:Probable beta-glucosidase G n=1 Tax=Plenodomus tracheiphilus IPT5 TaxID=1408161 RepID=A0A6A7AM97_9PLEO|nr:glycoside hydrolase family 3 protein [Plenodomus tracheiphilus IPT5]
MLRTMSWLNCATGAVALFGIKHSQYDSSPPVYPSRTPGPCVGNIAPIERLGFGGLCLQDGPLAVRQAIYTSVFPAQLSVAASWDRALARQRGVYMGSEFRGKGAHVALGPVVGPLGRSPFGGRNWEGFSPDTYLSGELVAATIEGIQSTGVQATTKHYIVNEQEIQRNPSFSVNGTNSKTMNGLLKEELGFQGYVMSDWGAVHSGVASIEAGLDLNMPGGIDFVTSSPSFFGANVTAAVNNGSLSVERVDDMALRIMTPYFHLGQDADFPPIDGYTPKIGFYLQSEYEHNFTLGPVVDVRRQEHAKLIRHLGAAGTVLLKNTNATLPLTQPMTIGVFGNDAADFTEGEYSLVLVDGGFANGDYDIGTLAVGGGSGTGRFTSVISPLSAIKLRAQTYGAHVQYITNNDAIIQGMLSSLAPLPLDVCLVFLKSWVSEGDDRTTLIADWNSTMVVERTAALCPNTVVVLHGAAPNVLPWVDNPNVTAILAAHMPGQETGNAIVDILWGDVNPSGRLPYSIACNETDYARNIVNNTELLHAADPNAWNADFVEENRIDYKDLDARNARVAYEFGFGLSYSTFELSDLHINTVHLNAPRIPDPRATVLPGGNVELWDCLVTVNATITNTGLVSGFAIPQLYLSYPEEARAPVQSLRGFEKILVEAESSCPVVFSLTRRDLSYWDTFAQTWRLPTGETRVHVGFSSRDLTLEGVMSI